jgi:hypothetical protein
MKKAVLIAFLATASAVALPIAAVSAAAAPEAKAASCARGTKPAVIAGNFKCLRVGLKCSASYQSAYRKYGFHCTKGRLRKGTGAPPPEEVFTPPPPYTPPAPAPAPPVSTPAAVDGHYKGVTSQNETIEFDITRGGREFRGLNTGQINAGCTPRFNLWGNYIKWGYIPQRGGFDFGFDVSSAGDFKLDTDLPGWHVGDWPASVTHLTIRGHMSGQAGSGSLEFNIAFTGNGVAYTCGSGLQTWAVMKIA